MRYVVAILGSLFIFVATFILSTLLVPFLPAFLMHPIKVGFVYTNNVVGLVLASLTATASFRATLHRYAKEKEAKADLAIEKPNRSKAPDEKSR